MGIKDVLRPLVHIYRKKRIEFLAPIISHHYDKIINSIRISGRKELNFAAYVIFDSTFGMDTVFKRMMNDSEHWNPKIVVIPDITKGRENAVTTYNKTKAHFISRYGEEHVLDGWNCESDQFADILDRFDIVYYANPYDDLVHKFHSIKYATHKNVLPIYISYGYDVGRYTTLSRLKSPELNFVWKLFADTTYTYHDYVNDQIIKGRNVVLAGYSKMDTLIQYPVSKSNRKRILISPHHSIIRTDIPLSNFLEFYNLILRLPDLFPDIDFVFRPHPLLFPIMINEGIWSKERVNQYLTDLQSKGVVYSTEGDYLKVFAECDAIVHDCGSFTVEWLFTGKPGCYVYNKNLNEDYLTTLMKNALTSYTIAKSENDILNFIRQISESDNKTDYVMQDWVKENIAINYPDVSSFILKEIDICSGGD